MHTVPLSCCAICGDIWVSTVYAGQPIGYRSATCEMRSERTVGGAGVGEAHSPRCGYIVETAYPTDKPHNSRQTAARALVDAIPDEQADHYWALAKLFAAADNSQE